MVKNNSQMMFLYLKVKKYGLLYIIVGFLNIYL